MAQGVNAHDQPEIIARLTPESADLFQVGWAVLRCAVLRCAAPGWTVGACNAQQVLVGSWNRSSSNDGC